MDELIEKAKSGDEDAFTSILLLYQQDLYKVAMSRLENQFDIDDVIQETIINAYLKLPKLRDISKFKIWLFKILINNCNMIYRKKKNIPIPLEDISHLAHETTSFNIIDSNLDFYSIVSLLNREDQTIATLYYASDCSVKDISKILKMNSNTVKTRLKRIREKLKNELDLEKGENIYE